MASLLEPEASDELAEAAADEEGSTRVEVATTELVAALLDLVLLSHDEVAAELVLTALVELTTTGVDDGTTDEVVLKTDDEEEEEEITSELLTLAETAAATILDGVAKVVVTTGCVEGSVEVATASVVTGVEVETIIVPETRVT